jgi:eukaryotic-like serine/threonine-protein kinase
MSSRGPSPAALPPGTRLGAFEVLASLGQGGMGAVYHVRNRITGDMRALKVILPELAASPEFVDRFVREMRLAMAVEHPNLVRVFEPGMDGDTMFLPMELLAGESLASRLKRDRWLKVDTAVGLLQAVGSALSALHARGILHRDVKPSNVFLAQEGEQIVPKLLDLGAGKEVGGIDEATATGLTIGSPHYMAPEHASGRKGLDARADQYSLGVLAYQLFTGARPYENDDTGHVLAKVLSGAPYKTPRELRPDIPTGVDAAVLRAMNRVREDRFPSVDAFVETLASQSFEPSVSSATTQLVSTPQAAVPAVSPPQAGPPQVAVVVTGSSEVGLGTGEPSGTMKAAMVPPPATSSSRVKLWAGALAAVAVVAVAAAVALPRMLGGTPDSPAIAGVSAATPPPPATSLAAAPSGASPDPVSTAPGSASAAQGPLPPPTSPAATPPSSAPPVAPVTLHPRAPAQPTRPAAPPRPASNAEPCQPTLGAPCL